MARPSKKKASKTLPVKSDGRETKGARTREITKDAILELIAEHGSPDFKLEEVCARTGLTVGAFYFHFESKEAAIREIVIDRLRSYFQNIVEMPPQSFLFAEIYAIVSHKLAVLQENPAAFRLPYQIIPTNWDVYTAWLQARSALIERLASTIARSRGHAQRVDGQDHLAAQFLMAGLEGFLENAFFGQDPMMKKIDLRATNLARDLAALWHKAVTGAEPEPRLVREVMLASRRPAETQRPSRQNRAK
jgi:AcrR family transcriptional regulator